MSEVGTVHRSATSHAQATFGLVSDWLLATTTPTALLDIYGECMVARVCYE